MEILEQLEEMVKKCGNSPLYQEMPKRGLEEKGMAGPTAAHMIEEIHTPLNIAATTYTTGTTAFQNLVGITHEEMPDRIRAGTLALEMAGLKRGEHVLITYPPLVNVFTKEALEQHGVTWSFPVRSGRDAFLAALCRERPRAVVGESSFIRASLEDSYKLGIHKEIPERVIILAVGTPLDLGLLEASEQFPGLEIHDLYGCQEFGWLVLDGKPLRTDIQIISCGTEGYIQLSVGGLLTEDCFPVKKEGHLLDSGGTILTYGRKRITETWETVIIASKAMDLTTVERMAKSILRLKSKVVYVSRHIELGAPDTIVGLCSSHDRSHQIMICGPEATGYLDQMLEAQIRYQREKKNDPSWLKAR